MKNISIRLKITLWFSAVLTAVVLLAFVGVFFVSDAVLQKGVRDDLVLTVEDNLDEIEYFGSLEEMAGRSDIDLYIAYAGGYLEIDDDFLYKMNGIYTGLYKEDGTLLYGENPLGRAGLEKAFLDLELRKFPVNGEGFYVYDRRLNQEGLEGLWLRGVVSKRQGEVQQNTIVGVSLVLMPLRVLLAVLEGYVMAGRALKPVKEIESAAKAICEGRDLKKRITLLPGGDELHQLADTFNEMLERLDSAFEAEQRFLSDASHELRTPMSVIEAQCEFVLESRRGAEEYERAIQVIRRQSRKMTRLITALLDFTRLECRTDYYKKEPVDMSALVASLCMDMALLKEKGIALTWDVEQNIRVQGSQELLSRLLTNLLSNAYQYGREQGHIWVRLCQGQGMVRLSVRDDGVGIAPQQQEKVFRRFYQADASRSNQGMGLGLAMVKEIAVFHGGEIQVESKEGEGSVFTLVLKALGG